MTTATRNPSEGAVVLGAGLTGLVTAWSLASANVPVTIIERARDIGGLAGTLEWDDWRFDYGPHNFHTADTAIVDFYRCLLPDGFFERPLNVKLHIFGNLVTYPLVGSDVLLILGGWTMARAMADFARTRLRRFVLGATPTDQLDQWITQRFGRVLYELYFGPYIRRVWRADPSRLSSIIGESRIPVLSIRRYIVHELLKRPRPYVDDLADWQSYYVRHGIGQLARSLYDRLRTVPHVSFRFGETVRAVHRDQSRVTAVTTDGGRIPVGAGWLVSTIPLNTLVAVVDGCPQPLPAQAATLQYCGERFLFVRLRTPRVSGYNWVYFSDADYPFHRVSEFNHDQFEMVPPGHTSLTFEYACDEGDREWELSDAALWATTRQAYARVFPISDGDVIDVRSAVQRYAYPRFTVNYDRTLKTLFAFIDSLENIYSIGRQGLFCYINTDGATRMGLDVADAILKGAPDRHRHAALLSRYHGLS